MPGYDDMCTTLPRAAVTGEADDEIWTMTDGEFTLAAGDLVRLILIERHDYQCDRFGHWTVVAVASVEDTDDYKLESLAGDAITISADAAGFFEKVQCSRLADEAEAAIVSTLMSQAINAVL